MARAREAPGPFLADLHDNRAATDVAAAIARKLRSLQGAAPVDLDVGFWNIGKPQLVLDSPDEVQFTALAIFAVIHSIIEAHRVRQILFVGVAVPTNAGGDIRGQMNRVNSREVAERHGDHVAAASFGTGPHCVFAAMGDDHLTRLLVLDDKERTVS